MQNNPEIVMIILTWDYSTHKNWVSVYNVFQQCLKKHKPCFSHSWIAWQYSKHAVFVVSPKIIMQCNNTFIPFATIYLYAWMPVALSAQIRSYAFLTTVFQLRHSCIHLHINALQSPCCSFPLTFNWVHIVIPKDLLWYYGNLYFVHVFFPFLFLLFK